MVALADIQRQREQIHQLAHRHGAHHLRVFGSLARGECSQASDVDLLVRMDADRSLLDRIALQQDLQDLLGVEVDVVNEKSLHPLVREQVRHDLVEL